MHIILWGKFKTIVIMWHNRTWDLQALTIKNNLRIKTILHMVFILNARFTIIFISNISLVPIMDEIYMFHCIYTCMKLGTDLPVKMI